MPDEIWAQSPGSGKFSMGAFATQEVFGAEVNYSRRLSEYWACIAQGRGWRDNVSGFGWYVGAALEGRW